MAALVKEINSITRYAEFAIDSNDEILDLPTTTTAGKNNLSTIKNCCAGSCAYNTKTLDVFLLSADDIWNMA